MKTGLSRPYIDNGHLSFDVKKTKVKMPLVQKEEIRRFRRELCTSFKILSESLSSVVRDSLLGRVKA